MNAHTTIASQPTVLRLTPPIALLRALPLGPLASAYLERQRQLAELFAAFENDDIEAAVDLLIAEYDARQGDPDLEDGDEDRCAAHDNNPSDFSVRRMGLDSDNPRDDDCTETSGWSEWRTRGRRKLTSAGTEKRGVCNTLCSPRHEDEEDDDPRERNGDEQDHNGSEEDFVTHASSGTGCPISDPDGEEAPDFRAIADPEAYKENVTRIRRTRCYQRFYRYRQGGAGQAVREPRGWMLYRSPISPTKRSLLRRKRGVPRAPRP